MRAAPLVCVCAELYITQGDEYSARPKNAGMLIHDAEMVFLGLRGLNVYFCFRNPDFCPSFVSISAPNC
jgi:hypothetical protein